MSYIGYTFAGEKLKEVDKPKHTKVLFSYSKFEEELSGMKI
jgi:hypothetical protein